MLSRSGVVPFTLAGRQRTAVWPATYMMGDSHGRRRFGGEMAYRTKAENGSIVFKFNLHDFLSRRMYRVFKKIVFYNESRLACVTNTENINYY